MRRSILILVASLVLTACGSSSGTPSDLAPGDLAPADPCAPYGTSSATGCVSTIAFAPSGALPLARDHHATAIAETSSGAYLYVIGGTDYTAYFGDVQVAKIAEDGTLGPFTETTLLPAHRAGHGIAVHGGRIYIAGGRASPFYASVLSAAINDDGTVGAWRSEADMPAARFHLSLVASDTHLYAIGGVELPADPTAQYTATSDVFYAAFGTDGSVGAWQTGTPLPESRSHHAAVLHGNQMFLVGGFVMDTADGSPLATHVLEASIGADGTPGTFAEGVALPEPSAALAAIEVQGALYAVGGLNEDDTYSARIRRAQLLDGGGLGDFTDAGMLPVGRSHVHHTPYYKGHFYSGGGSIAAQVVTDAVWVGSFAPSSGLGSSTQGLTLGKPKKGRRCMCGLAVGN